MYTPVPKLSRNLLGTIYHVIPSSEHKGASLNSLVMRQHNMGLDARLVLVDHDPKAGHLGNFTIQAEQEVNGVPITRVSGNLGNPAHADFEAYEHFGRFFWQTMINSLREEDQNAAASSCVVHFHNALMLPAAAMAPEVRGPETSGTVFTEIWPNWAESRQAFRTRALANERMRTLITKLDAAHESDAPVVRKTLPNCTIHLGLPENGNIDELTQTYLQARYGVGHAFSENMIEHLRRLGTQVIDNLIIVTPAPPSEKNQIIDGIMADPVLSKTVNRDGIKIFHLSQFLDPELPDVIAPPADRELGNVFSYLSVLVKLMNMIRGNRQERLASLRIMLANKSTVLLIGGGSGTRLPAGKRDKSEVFFGESQFRNVTLLSLLPTIAQHPFFGANRVYLTGCDQLYGTRGVQKTGDHLLSSADDSMIIYMAAHRNPDAATLQMLTNRGIGFTDSTSHLAEGHEKIKPAAAIQARMSALSRTDVMENTMVQSLDPEVLLMYLSLLTRPSAQESGKTLLEALPLDLCRDLLFHLVSLSTDKGVGKVRNELTKKLAYPTGAVDDKGKPIMATICQADLDTLINGLKEINQAIKTPLVLPVDRFIDTGDFAEYCNAVRLMLHASSPVGLELPEDEARKQAEEHDFGYWLRYISRLGRRSHDENVMGEVAVGMCARARNRASVVTLHSPLDTVIGPQVRIALGNEFSNNTLIAGETEFSPKLPTKCPPNLIIFNSRILGELRFAEPVDPSFPFAWRLIANVTIGPDEVLEVARGGAVIGYHVPNSFYDDPAEYTKVGLVPMGVNLKDEVKLRDGTYAKDPVNGLFMFKGEKEPDDIPHAEHSWKAMIRVWDERHQVIVPPQAFAEIADPGLLNPVLRKAGLLKPVNFKVVKKEEAEAKKAEEAKRPADEGIPGLDDSIPGLDNEGAIPGLDDIPGLPAANEWIPGLDDIPGLPAAAPVAVVSTPAKPPVRVGDYYVPQNFRQLIQVLKQALAEASNKSLEELELLAQPKDKKTPPSPVYVAAKTLKESGLQLDPGQIDRLLQLMIKAHSEHR